MFKRLLAMIILLSCALLLNACQTDVYTPREECLNSIIKQCKQNGWHYMMTNPVCKQAGAGGIYSLTTEQLEQCRPVDKHSCAANKPSLYQHRNFKFCG